MQFDKDTLSTIPEVIFDGYEFDPHPHVVEQDQLKGYHHISNPEDDTCSVTNDENIDRYFSSTRCSVCGTYGNECFECTLAEAVYQKEKQFQLSKRDSWKLKATTTTPNNTPSSDSETPDIDIPELNIKEAPNDTHMWPTEEWATRNAPIARHEL